MNIALRKQFIALGKSHSECNGSRNKRKYAGDYERIEGAVEYIAVYAEHYVGYKQHFGVEKYGYRAGVKYYRQYAENLEVEHE